MIKCDSCVQCRHGRPEDGWPNEEHTWVAECRDYSGVVIVPFAGYKDFKECVSKNQDKSNPKGYCASIMRKVEGKDMDNKIVKTQTRMLNISIGGDTGKLVALGDGGLVVKEVLALASGEWTDSNVRKPLFYPEKVLRKDAANWVADTVWSRHAGGTPRDITSMLGKIQNPRYSDADKGVLVDVFYHGRNQASRDVIDMVKAGVTSAVSVEHGGTEFWNAETKRNEAASVAFYGMANVDRGACTVCGIRLNELGHCLACDDHDKTKEGESMGDETKQPTEAEKKLADLESEKAGFVKELAALNEKLQADEKARTERIAELEKLLSEKDARVKELEKKPVPLVTVSGDTADDGDRELSAPPMRIIFRGGQVERA